MCVESLSWILVIHQAMEISMLQLNQHEINAMKTIMTTILEHIAHPGIKRNFVYLLNPSLERLHFVLNLGRVEKPFLENKPSGSQVFQSLQAKSNIVLSYFFSEFYFYFDCIDSFAMSSFLYHRLKQFCKFLCFNEFVRQTSS